MLLVEKCKEFIPHMAAAYGEREYVMSNFETSFLIRKPNLLPTK